MSWGSCFFYYQCQVCAKKYKIDADLIPVLGPQFGICPGCGSEGLLIKDGPRTPDDNDYEEID